jgi:hypothetical protein
MVFPHSPPLSVTMNDGKVAVAAVLLIRLPSNARAVHARLV